MIWEILGIGLYVVGMIFLAYSFSKKIKTDEDYYLGGRSLGPGLVTFSLFATWFGAETCIGTSGAVYREGLSSIHADPVGYTLCLFLMAIFFSKVLWQKKITTIPDLFRERYSPKAEKMAALLMIPGSLFWAAAQVRALGQIISATTLISPTIAVSVGALVVIFYTMYGGLLADAYADLIQGLAVIVGLLILMVVMVVDLGGVSNTLSLIPLEKLSFFHPKDHGLSFLGRLEIWLVPVMGALISQELVGRVVAARSDKVATHSAYRAGVLYFMIGLIPVFFGLLGHHYFPDLQDSEMLMPLLAKTHLNSFFYIIFVGALVSAILSTVDTTLLSSSALMSHNIFYPFYPQMKEKHKIRLARGSTLLAGILSYALAYSSTSITELVKISAVLGGPTILVLTIMALWDKRGNAFSALFSMVISIFAWASAHYYFQLEFPVIFTVTTAAAGYMVSSFFVPRKVTEDEALKTLAVFNIEK